MKNKLTAIKKILAGGITGILLMSSSAYASAIALRVDGLYCNLCSGGTITQLRAVEGVSSVHAWFANGILWVTPGNVNLGALKKIINASSYGYKGAWQCPGLTGNLNRCKRMD